MTENTRGRSDGAGTLDRRTVLRGGAAIGAAGLVGGIVNGLVGAQSSDALVVNDFDTSHYPGENALGEWSDAEAFVSAEVTSAGLRLEYDDGGFFASKVHQDVSAYDTLQLRINGLSGGEESDIQLEVGGVEDVLANLTDDTIQRSFSVVSVDLVDMGVDRTSVDDVRLNFWQGGASEVEIQTIAFGDITTSVSTPTEAVGTPDLSERPWPWEAAAGNEKEPANAVAPADITADTTVAELCPTFDDSGNAHMYVPRSMNDYMPGSTTDPGSVDITQTNLSDEEKAGLYDVNVSAIQSSAGDGSFGSLPLSEFGTQTLSHVQTYVENGLPYHATAQLLPRIMLLPDETESQPYHKGGDPWAETAGPATPTNDPSQLIQREWPTDARTYVPDEKYERDRAHDQPNYEDGWTNGTPGEEVYADESHPLRVAIENNEHPVTGESLGSGFTANAPIEAEAKIHQQNGYLYQVLDFKNVQSTPFYVDTAIIWWVGPAGLSTLRNGHYNNAHRPGPGYGHPQRDIIEVIYDRERSLSAYAIRLAQHDEPYNMRTAYPNQMWGLEQGVPESDPINNNSARFTSSEERQALVDTMLETLHIEIETNLDRNDELHEALELHNRVSN